MTTTNRMSNFKLLAQRFAQGEKLLTTHQKMMAMACHLSFSPERFADFGRPQFPSIKLVLHARKN
jgi:hypothetical protein